MNFTKEIPLTADMSVAPEIARLAESLVLVPAQPAASAETRSAGPGPAGPGPAGAGPAGAGPAGTGPDGAGPAGTEQAGTQLTVGTLARRLRSIAASPERWWSLVRFEPDRSVTITVEDSAAYRAWLVILPPGDAGQSCDCDVATMIAGEATDGPPASAALRPGPVRVHGETQRHGEERGQQHGLRGRGAGYSISLHARVHRPAARK